MEQYLIFQVGDLKIATPIALIQRISLIVAFKKIPNSGPSIIGMINVQGVMVELISLRNLFGLLEKEIELSDTMLICAQENERFAFLVDCVIGTEYCSDQESSTSKSTLKNLAPQKFVQAQGHTYPVYNLIQIISQAHDYQA